MNIVVISSEINYCPQNYDAVIEQLLSRLNKNIAGIIIVKSDKWEIYRKRILLKFLSCENLYRTLSDNQKYAKEKRKEAIAKKHNIEIQYSLNPNSERLIQWIKNIGCDLIVNMRTRSIFHKELLELPRLGCVNIHHGLLPEQRGLFCDLMAISDDRETGISIHKMTERIDDGDVYCRKTVIGNKNYMQYLESLSQCEGDFIADFLNNVVKAGVLPKKKRFDFNRVVVTTTPDRKEIKELKKKGLIL